MDISIFRFAYPLLLLALLVLVSCVAWWVLYKRVGVYYSYSLASMIKARGFASNHKHKQIIFSINLVILLMLAIVSARPQWGDMRTKTHMDGVDIVIALDVSGSMQVVDERKDNRSRIDIAKDEALHFINKRHNDAIGLVLFAQDALSRCPVTHDKKIVREIVEGVQIGLLDPNGTHLAMGLVTAANRLKSSKAASKIIILLTDGAPSEGDFDPQIAIDVAKQLGIKVYTIGIGGDNPVQIMTPLGSYGMYMPVNKELLQKIAQQTGAKFFRADNAKDMRAVYDAIDTLEKSSYEVEHFTTYYDLYASLGWIAFMLILLRLILSTLVWFAL